MKKTLSLFLAVSCASAACAISAAQAAPKMNVDAITTEKLHIRSGPGRSHKAQDVLPADFPLVVGNCTRAWCQVYYNGVNGWAYMPSLAFRDGTSFAQDPNLGPFVKGRVQRGKLVQTAYLTPEAARAGSAGGMGSGLGKLAGMAFSLGKKGFMTATPMGGALTAASAVKGGLGKAQGLSNMAGGAMQNGAGGLLSSATGGFSRAAGGHGRAAAGLGNAANMAASNLAANAQTAAGQSGAARTGWWNNYQRPSYNAAWQQQKWWPKKKK